ncbi:hypothetical protein, partial [Arachidicoccus sp.]|uniref:hypothetical protein n=1 Tax=Arachidicoccus sp. TaxID=1872624 RepID=UPI003D24B08E
MATAIFDDFAVSTTQTGNFPCLSGANRQNRLYECLYGYCHINSLKTENCSCLSGENREFQRIYMATTILTILLV